MNKKGLAKIMALLQSREELKAAGEVYGPLVALASLNVLDSRGEFHELTTHPVLSKDEIDAVGSRFKQEVSRARHLLKYVGSLLDEEVLLVISLYRSVRLVAQLLAEQLPVDLLHDLSTLESEFDELKKDASFMNQFKRCNKTVINSSGFDID